MKNEYIPNQIPNWIDGEERPASSGEWLDKLDPATGQLLCKAARSRAEDVHQAIQAAKDAQPGWAEVPPVQRGLILHEIVKGIQARQDEVAQIVATETGKSFSAGLGETGGAAQCGLFYASEGQRL